MTNSHAKLNAMIMSLINDEHDENNQARDAFHDVLRDKMHSLVSPPTEDETEATIDEPEDFTEDRVD